MTETPFRLGWEEWIALSALGLPALKVKVDTGARTSALHAHDIEPFGTATAPMIRFIVHPIPSRPDLSIACSAPIADRREVTSSNGEVELRYVIETMLTSGDRSWPIELTLTDRGSMAYRMLLGRQAFPEDVVVVPNESFCQPELSYDAYRATRMRKTTVARALRIALLCRDGDVPGVARLIDEASSRGHTVERIDPLRCYVPLVGLTPEIHRGGARLPHFDAVVPLFGASNDAYDTVIVRQFEATGSWSVNSSQAISTNRDALHTHQALSRHKVPLAPAGFAASPEDAEPLADLLAPFGLPAKGQVADRNPGAPLIMSRQEDGTKLRCIVIDGKTFATARPEAAPKPRKQKPARADLKLAEKAAKAIRLGLAGVDLVRGVDGTTVVAIDSMPDLDRAEPVGAVSVYAALIDAIEKHARPAPMRRRRTKSAS